MTVSTADYVVYQCCRSIDGPIANNIGGHIQSGLFSERMQPTCTCKAFKYSKRDPLYGKLPCKHIIQAQKEACGWHQAYSDEAQEQDGVCPRCGGPTVGVRWAV